MAPERIADLIADFQAHADFYGSSKFKETETRVKFIDPLFAELGWDIANRSGVAPQYQEVIHEDTLQVAGSAKAPDYSFRVGGVRKFFVEAKKPSINVKGDAAPAYQVRRYAWSAKLPLSIVTDFQEFAVYDCRIRPNPSIPRRWPESCTSPAMST